MFKINDLIVYNSVGVYKIIDIRKEEDIKGKDTEYYILQPVYNDNLTIKVPVNNPKIFMRKVISKDDALSLIASMPNEETVWIEDVKKRNEQYKAAIKTGESAKWIRIIKTLYLKKKERSDEGKKLMKIDEDIMKAAEKILYEEFATVLKIEPDEVVSYIQEYVS